MGLSRNLVAVAAVVLGATACAGEQPPRMRVAPRSTLAAVAHASPARAPIAHEELATLAVVDATTAPSPRGAARSPFTLAAVGDVMLARTIGARISGSPPESPFDAIAPVLRAADVTVANLECAVGTGGAPVPKAFNFRAPPLALGALVDAGIDVVSLANNHVLDFGADTLGETLSRLDDLHLVHAGAGLSEESAHRAGTLDVHGYRLAFLAYVKVPVEGVGGFDTASWEAKGETPGLAWADPARIASDVADAKAHGADVVIVMIHSGFEQSQTPNIWQIDAARAAIDAGATLVLGAHPHVLEGARRYKHGFIAYSLGNFVFDGTDIVSAILRVTLDREGVKGVEWTPVILRNGFPQPTDEPTTRYVLNMIKGLSTPLGDSAD